ncbi:hypothetical protein MKEN_01398700 [Mycena kentingensis (nom. inval.)]|nr:hypothetical protein MKEN_01398700 [Mycena kentingensis (nom. inval.)]
MDHQLSSHLMLSQLACAKILYTLRRYNNPAEWNPEQLEMLFSGFPACSCRIWLLEGKLQSKDGSQHDCFNINYQTSPKKFWTLEFDGFVFASFSIPRATDDKLPKKFLKPAGAGAHLVLAGLLHSFETGGLEVSLEVERFGLGAEACPIFNASAPGAESAMLLVPASALVFRALQGPEQGRQWAAGVQQAPFAPPLSAPPPTASEDFV